MRAIHHLFSACCEFLQGKQEQHTVHRLCISSQIVSTVTREFREALLPLHAVQSSVVYLEGQPLCAQQATIICCVLSVQSSVVHLEGQPLCGAANTIICLCLVCPSLPNKTITQLIMILAHVSQNKFSTKHEAEKRQILAG